MMMLLSFVIIPQPSPSSYIFLVEGAKVTTYYDVLELKSDASLQDVKKSYRRLAVLHHPDRNIGNEEEATIKFREISEAYEVLSDDESRRQYDQSLKGAGADSGFHRYSFGGGSGGGGATWSHERRNNRHRHRDPFAQFNDVFQNDPFFAEAFKSLDDLFDKHFADVGNNEHRHNNQRRRSRTQQAGEERSKDVDDDAKNNDGGGFIWKIAKKFLPNIQVTTSYSSNYGGQTTYSSTSRQYGGSSSSSSSRSSSNSRSRVSSSSSSSSSSTYTSRSTRTIIQNGQRVTIQSLEKDGNKIEEKYIGDKLIERKINGRNEEIGRIDDGGGEF